MPEVVIDNFPQTVTDNPFDVGVTVKGAKAGTNYLRVELYKDGDKSYYGETFNGKDWYGGNDGKQYFPIQISSASASAIIQVRIGKIENGDYKLKVKRYTASGNAANDLGNPVDIKVNYNLETPQPTATQIGTEAPVINENISTIVPTEILEDNIATKSTKIVLAESTELPIYTDPPKNINTNRSPQSFPIFPAIIFALGLFCIGITIYKVYNKSHVFHSKKVS